MPRAPKKCATATCEERVRGSRHCVAHTPKPWQGSTGPRRTQAAQDLREQVMREEPTCRDCGAPSTEAGHIIPHAYGGAYVRGNLKGQCRKCNVAQIATDRVKYGA